MVMRKFLVINMLCAAGALSGCAGMLPMTGAAPQPMPPATPIFFQPFSANLDAPALSAIAATAKAANAEPDARVLVTGAADTVGSAKANALLSRTRAQVVADALVADGVAPGRIRTKGLGETTTPGSAVPTQFSRRAVIQIGG